MSMRGCPDDDAAFRVEHVAGTYSAICTCGWRSSFLDSRDEVAAAWAAHRDGTPEA